LEFVTHHDFEVFFSLLGICRETVLSLCIRVSLVFVTDISTAQFSATWEFVTELLTLLYEVLGNLSRFPFPLSPTLSFLSLGKFGFCHAFVDDGIRSLEFVTFFPEIF